MKRIAIVELSEQEAHLPAVARLDSDAAPPLEPFDLLICVLGFEGRALSVPRLLTERGCRARRARYLTYTTNIDDNRGNETLLLELLRSLSDDVDGISGDDADFTRWLSALLASLVVDGDHSARVALDISVASNRLVMRCMKALLESSAQVVVLYSEADVYHPTREEWESDPSEWTEDESLGLQRGVGDLDFSVEYPGMTLDPLPSYAMLFPGFNRARSRAVLSALDPAMLQREGADRVLWLIGVPHAKDNAWRVDALRQINGITSHDQQRELSTFDYRETLRELDAAYRLVDATHQVTLAPMGSKLQALGASLFCYLHPEVRVVFANPREYHAARYSHGCKGIWLIDFGAIGEIRAILDRVGAMVIVEEASAD